MKCYQTKVDEIDQMSLGDILVPKLFEKEREEIESKNNFLLQGKQGEENKSSSFAKSMAYMKRTPTKLENQIV